MQYIWIHLAFWSTSLYLLFLKAPLFPSENLLLFFEIQIPVPSTLLLKLCLADWSLRQSGTLWILCPDQWVKRPTFVGSIPGQHQVLTVLVSPASLHSRLTLVLPSLILWPSKNSVRSQFLPMNAPLLKLILINFWCSPLTVIFKKFSNQPIWTRCPEPSGQTAVIRNWYDCYWRSIWQPTPVRLPGISHGWRGLVGLQSTGSRRVRHD